RHFGVSHHTITALSKVALGSTNVVLPKLSLIEKERVFKQLNTIPLNKHQIIVGNGQRGIKKAKDIGLKLSHMGREYEDDKAFFLTASAVGEEVADKVTNQIYNSIL
ncbi:MAG: DUF3866 family protein, partial [Clostridia bacterium]|nr:DUF3866 family protein [Clostridia bacterium]